MRWFVKCCNKTESTNTSKSTNAITNSDQIITNIADIPQYYDKIAVDADRYVKGKEDHCDNVRIISTTKRIGMNIINLNSSMEPMVSFREMESMNENNFSDGFNFENDQVSGSRDNSQIYHLHDSDITTIKTNKNIRWATNPDYTDSSSSRHDSQWTHSSLDVNYLEGDIEGDQLNNANSLNSKDSMSDIPKGIIMSSPIPVILSPRFQTVGRDAACYAEDEVDYGDRSSQSDLSSTDFKPLSIGEKSVHTTLIHATSSSNGDKLTSPIEAKYKTKFSIF